MNILNREISDSSSAAVEISGNLDSFGRLIENQSSAVTESTAAVEEMIASLDNVARITETKEQSSRQLAETTRKGGDLVEETTRQIVEIANEVGFHSGHDNSYQQYCRPNQSALHERGHRSRSCRRSR